MADAQMSMPRLKRPRVLTVSLLITGLVCSGSLSRAENQRLTAQADGHVTFHTALNGVTRVSVRDDRIRELVYAETNYEVKNDGETGDIYLRYSGPGEGADSGYIITEGGNTISYSIEPRETSLETVLINVTGGAGAARAVSAPPPVTTPAVSAPVIRTTRAAPQTTETSKGGPVDAFVAAVVKEGINGSEPPENARNNALVSRYRSQDYVGDIRVATARRDRVVDQDDFLKDGVLAVWIAEPNLKAGGKSWVVVVKPREANS